MRSKLLCKSEVFMSNCAQEHFDWHVCEGAHDINLRTTEGWRRRRRTRRPSVAVVVVLVLILPSISRISWNFVFVNNLEQVQSFLIQNSTNCNNDNKMYYNVKIFFALTHPTTLFFHSMYKRNSNVSILEHFLLVLPWNSKKNQPEKFLLLFNVHVRPIIL